MRPGTPSRSVAVSSRRPSDRPDVAAVQGTGGEELFDQVDDLDVLLLCCGGGGLLSGCALAARPPLRRHRRGAGGERSDVERRVVRDDGEAFCNSLPWSSPPLSPPERPGGRISG